MDAAVKPHTGILALLDSLGTRTGTIEQAVDYVTSLDTLQRDVEGSLKVYLAKHPKETLKFYDQLKTRFFGDSVLLTYEVQQEQELYLYAEYLFAVLAFLQVAALESRILFRGAIAVGDFIERDNVVLGPAVNDAASWYDRFDMIGVATTPAATHRIKNSYYIRDGNSKAVWNPDLMLYDVPTKGGKTENLFLVNWPTKLVYKRGHSDPRDWLKEYFTLIAQFPVPIGTEQKFTHTEAFVRKSIETWQEPYEQARVAVLAAISSEENNEG